MSFQIFEQGRRIETPWQKSFPARQVNRLEKSAATAPISAERDTTNAEGHDNPSSPASEYQRQQSSDTDSRERLYRADQVMVSPVLTLRPAQTLDEAWSMFESNSIRHLPVVDEDSRVLGLVSQRQLLKVTSGLSGPAMARSRAGMNYAPVGGSSVASIMRRRVLTATADTNLRELTKVMVERHVGSILILSDPDHRLLGIITRSDVLKAVSHQVPLELWA